MRSLAHVAGARARNVRAYVCAIALLLIATPGASATTLRSEITATPDVAAGCDSTALVRSDGTVWTWGVNTLGQLGDGTTTSGEAPRAVLTAPATALTDVVAIAMGCTNGYALRGDGSVWAWGSNLHGQLGQGSAVGPANCGGTACSLYAVRVTTGAGPTYLDHVTSIAAGTSHVAARRADGSVWTWGRGDSAQLGNQSTTGPDTCAAVGCSTRAIRVTDPGDSSGFLSSVLDVAAGDQSTIALRVDGLVRAWGSDAFGATGHGSSVGTTLNPTAVQQASGGFPALDRVKEIDGAGSTYRALRSDGTVHTWGAGGQGQLGDTTTTASQTRSVNVLDPTLATPLDRVREIGGGPEHGIAIRADGTAWAWGRNDWGQLGDLSQAQRTRPVQVNDAAVADPLELVVHVTGGGTHSVAVLADGTVRSWGDDQNGQLGLAVPPPSCGARLCSLYARAGVVGVGTGYRAVAASLTTSFALAADGTVLAWGDNTDGQTGTGIEDGLYSGPRQVLVSAGVPLDGIVAISAAAENGLAVRADGTVWAWGDGSTGQLGQGGTGDSNWAIKVKASAGVDLTDVIGAGGIDRATYFLGVDGRVRAVGRNTYGALGDNTTTQRTYPVIVEQSGGADLDGVVALGVRGGEVDAASMVRDDGTAWLLGMNGDGQLGQGSSSGPSSCGGTACSRRAVQLLAAAGTPMTGVVSTGTSYYAGHALTANGWLWSWGVNERGEIGNATTSMTDVPYPVRVATNDTNTAWVELATSVVSGNYSPVARVGDGGAIGWGSNTHGELGDNSFVSPRRYRTQVAGIGGPGVASMITHVEAGGEYSIARDAAGRALTWGRDEFGQLGACTTTYASRRWPDLVQASCGVNRPPNILGTAAQYRSDASTALAIGTWTDETTIVVKADVADPDDAQTMRLFVEIRPNNVPFSAACGDTGDPAVFQSSVSGSITTGDAVQRSVTITGLVSGTQYHWRACVRDGGGTGLSSPFYAPEGNPDVSVDTSTPAPGTYGARQVAAGCDNTGVVLSDGSVWMAGSSAYGQLGNGTTSGSSATPVQVRVAPAGATALTDVRSLAVGCGFALAVKTDGTVWAWGRNDTSQLGGASATSCGGTTCSEWAVQVDPANVSNIKSVAAGFDFGFALRADGKLLAWGNNSTGQLGRGSVGGTSASAAPVRNTANTADLTNIVSISAGNDFAIASDASGAVWAWGCNDDNQLGAGLVVSSDYPTAREVLQAAGTPLGRVKRVTAGERHSLALLDDGTIRSWGFNGSGQLGINATGGNGQYAAPVRDSSGTTLTGWRDMAAGGSHSLAIRADGTTWAWGFNGSGGLGDNSTTSQQVPVQMRDSTNAVIPSTAAFFKAIAGGTSHTAIVQASGQVWGVGAHGLGQLGRTGAVTGCAGTCSTYPVTASFSLGAGAISTAAIATGGAMLRADGTLRTWGNNSQGTLGNGTFNGQTPRLQTVEVSAGVPLSNVVEITGGELAFYATLADGTVWSWGGGGSGRLGNNSSGRRTRAVQVRNASASADSGPPLVDIIDVSAHDQGAYALDASGLVWSWGNNDFGELGSGVCCSSRDYAQPVLRAPATNLDRIVRLGTNGPDGDDGFAIRSDGTVWAWGENQFGQLAQGSAIGPETCNASACSTFALQALAAPATPMTNVIDVDAANNAGFALAGDGTVSSWGYGGSGRLGNNDTGDRAYPVSVRASSSTPDTGAVLSNVIALGGTTDSGAALDATGRVLVWGLNSTGQLGLGNTTQSNFATPTTRMPSTTLTGAYLLSDGGEDHGVNLVDSSGRVMTAGANWNYQLADCTSATRQRYDVIRDPCSGNLAPIARWNTVYRDDHVTKVTLGQWIPDGITNNIYLDFNATDPDDGETLTPYIEFAPLGVPFSATCGDTGHPNVIAGAPVAVAVAGDAYSVSFPMTGLTIGTQYHWRSCVKDAAGSPSAWSTAATPPNPDFGIDDQRPANPASVDDGATRGVDADIIYSLTEIDATWPFGVDGGGSGLVQYDYCITTSATGADCGGGATRTWTSNGYLADLNATGLTLVHGTTYHVCVRATDGAGNQALGMTCSDGAQARFTLSAVTPNAGVQGESTVTVELTGEGFLATDSVSFSGTGISIVSVTRVSDTQLDVVVDIAAGATPGARNVTVSHTGADTSSVTLNSSFTVVAVSITVSLSTLGYTDAARDNAAPHAIGFGTGLLPGDVREIGPAGSGQTLAGAAAQVTVVSNGAWRLQLDASDFTNGASGTVPAGAFAWKHFGVAEAWTPFTTTAATIEGAGAGNAANSPGGTTYSYDWRLTLPANQAPGTYTGTVTYTAIPAV